MTLTQQFVAVEDLDASLDRVAAAIAGFSALPLVVTGAGRGRSSVWMAIERTPALLQLHRHVMDALEPFERAGGDRNAFIGGDARPGDVTWVSDFRRASSGEAFTPHITLGHSETVPQVEPVTFEATTIAACHLGRFCTCRHVVRKWDLRR